MSSILKSVLKEENELVKVNYSSYNAAQSKEAVTIFGASGRLTIRLITLPNEIVLKSSGDGVDEEYHEMRARCAVSLRNLKDVNPTVYDKATDLLRSAWPKVDSENPVVVKLREDFNTEMTELFEHVTTFIKAKSIAFQHDLEEALKHQIIEVEKQIKTIVGEN